MSVGLGPRTAMGVQNLYNPIGDGFWTVAFDPAVFAINIAFEIYHAAVSGPPASTFQVFIDTLFYDYAVRGDINSWDPAQPMIITPGHTLYYYWNTGAGIPPTVTVSCRETSAF